MSKIAHLRPNSTGIMRVHSAVAAAEAAIMASFQECSNRNIGMLFYDNHLATWRRCARFLSLTSIDLQTSSSYPLTDRMNVAL